MRVQPIHGLDDGANEISLMMVKIVSEDIFQAEAIRIKAARRRQRHLVRTSPSSCAAQTLRIADGFDEVHRIVIARSVFKCYHDSMSWDFSA